MAEWTKDITWSIFVFSSVHHLHIFSLFGIAGIYHIPWSLHWLLACWHSLLMIGLVKKLFCIVILPKASSSRFLQNFLFRIMVLDGFAFSVNKRKSFASHLCHINSSVSFPSVFHLPLPSVVAVWLSHLTCPSPPPWTLPVQTDRRVLVYILLCKYQA